MKKALLLSTLLYLLSPLSTHAQTIDILWEGDGYTPPFYEGGVPWTSEGVVRFVAVPEGLGSPATLDYKWTRNGTVLGNTNGVGANTLEIDDSLFSRPQSVSVEIVSGDTILASDAAYVTPRIPKLLVYENNPLYGFLFNQEVSGNYTLAQQELRLTAFPLFFSIPTRSYPYITYTWRSGGREDSASDSVTYRAPEGASGAASVSVKATNTETLKQTVEKNFLIQFNNEPK